MHSVCCCIVKCPYRCITSPCGMCRTPLNRRITVLYVITFFIILPYFCANVRYSAFYSIGNSTQAIEYFRDENTRRIKMAEEYFQSLEKSGKDVLTEFGPAVKGADPVRVALTVITVSRNRHAIDNVEPKYLSQVIWKYLILIQNEQKNTDPSYPWLRVQLSVCNVDHDPATYRELDSISQFVPTFSRFNTTHFSMVHVLEKEKQDYIFCLNRSLDSHPDYVFLVEDDALPNDNLFQVLRHTLHYHIENGWERGNIVPRRPNMAYVKFYHPDRVMNFIGLEIERLPELFSYIALLSLPMTGLYLMLFKLDSTITLYTVWKKMAIYAFVVLIAVGRSGISQWMTFASPTFYQYVPAPTCCTPAVMFPRAAAHDVVEFLNSSVCKNAAGKDALLDRMVKQRNMKAFLVYPNSFTHIGMYSSLRERLVDPFLV